MNVSSWDFVSGINLTLGLCSTVHAECCVNHWQATTQIIEGKKKLFLCSGVELVRTEDLPYLECYTNPVSIAATILLSN